MLLLLRLLTLAIFYFSTSYAQLPQLPPGVGEQIFTGLASSLLNTFLPQLNPNLNQQQQQFNLRQQPSFSGIPVLSAPRTDFSTGNTLFNSPRGSGTFDLQSFSNNQPFATSGGNDLSAPLFPSLSQLSGSLLPNQGGATGNVLRSGGAGALPFPPAASTGNLLEDVSRVGILPALINLGGQAITNNRKTPSPPSAPIRTASTTASPDDDDSDTTEPPATVIERKKLIIAPAPAPVSSGGLTDLGQPQQPEPIDNKAPFVITADPNRNSDARLRAAVLAALPQSAAAVAPPQTAWPRAPTLGGGSGLLPFQNLPPQSAANLPSIAPGLVGLQQSLPSGSQGLLAPQSLTGGSQFLFPNAQQQLLPSSVSLASLAAAQQQGFPIGQQQQLPQQVLGVPQQQTLPQILRAGASQAKSRLITQQESGNENFGSNCPQCIPIDLQRLAGPWVQVYGNPQALRTIYTSVAHLQSLYGDDSVEPTEFAVIQPTCIGIQFSKPQGTARKSESTMNLFYRDDSSTKQLHEAVGRVKQDLDASPNAVNFKLPAFDLPMCLVKSGPETSTMYGYVVLAETIGTNRCRSYHVFTRHADTFFRDYNSEVAAYLKEQVDEGGVKPVGVLPFPDLCQLQNIAKLIS